MSPLVYHDFRVQLANSRNFHGLACAAQAAKTPKAKDPNRASHCSAATMSAAARGKHGQRLMFKKID